MELAPPYLVHRCSDDRWNALCESALKYALISIPFTINRMGIDAIERRVFNILKGKLSELLFNDFALKSSLDVDFQSCATPFHQVDRRDFLWKESEWDLKNNFLTTRKLSFSRTQLDHLPALIPSNFKGDQWDKRERLLFKNSKSFKVLFSFMIGKLEDGPLVTPWAHFTLSEDQKKWLNNLNSHFKGKPQVKAPFTEAWFWNHWEQISLPWNKLLDVNFNSPIYVTSFAGPKDWTKFKEVPPRSFSGGMFRTKITNRACAIKNLRPFSELMVS